MTDVDKYCDCVDFTRRKTFLTGASLLAFGVSTQAAFANGGRDPQIRIIYDDTPEKIKKQKDAVTYSQVRYVLLGHSRISSLYYKMDKGKLRLHINGFSDRFAPNILKMSYMDIGWTRHLMRGMHKLKTVKPRKDRLKLELGIAYKRENELKISVNYLRKQKSPKLKEEKTKLFHARGYRAGVRVWQRSPLEGTF